MPFTGPNLLGSAPGRGLEASCIREDLQFRQAKLHSPERNVDLSVKAREMSRTIRNGKCVYLLHSLTEQTTHPTSPQLACVLSYTPGSNEPANSRDAGGSSLQTTNLIGRAADASPCCVIKGAHPDPHRKTTHLTRVASSPQGAACQMTVSGARPCGSSFTTPLRRQRCTVVQSFAAAADVSVLRTIPNAVLANANFRGVQYVGIGELPPVPRAFEHNSDLSVQTYVCADAASASPRSLWSSVMGQPTAFRAMPPFRFFANAPALQPPTIPHDEAAKSDTDSKLQSHRVPHRTT